MDTSDNDVEFAGDLEDDDSEDNPVEDCQIQWAETDDINLDAAHLETDWSTNGHTESTDSSEDVFFDCEPAMPYFEELSSGQPPMRECCTIFDVSAVIALSGATGSSSITDCV